MWPPALEGTTPAWTWLALQAVPTARQPGAFARQYCTTGKYGGTAVLPAQKRARNACRASSQRWRLIQRFGIFTMHTLLLGLVLNFRWGLKSGLAGYCAATGLQCKICPSGLYSVAGASVSTSRAMDSFAMAGATACSSYSS
jgi:hypothetical protein